MGKLIYEDAPEAVRVGLREILTNMGRKGPSEQRVIICRALRRRPNEDNWSEYPNIDFEVDQLVHGIEWYVFYDMCEKIAHIEPTFEYELNKLFHEEGIGYKMTGGRISKVGTEAFNEAVDETLKELQGPQFKAPLEQFRKALDFRNALPPDYPNAVKEAVNSIEGVLQIANGRLGVALPTILGEMQPKFPSHFKHILKAIYGYGSASEGARHSGVGGPIPTGEEAEFIIHCAAAAIGYIIGNYSFEAK